MLADALSATERMFFCTEKNVSDVVPPDETGLLKEVLAVEARIKVAESTKLEGKRAESNIKFTDCAKSLNTLLV